MSTEQPVAPTGTADRGTTRRVAAERGGHPTTGDDTADEGAESTALAALENEGGEG